VDQVPGLRAVLVTVPHLLADLIRHVLTSRAALCVVAELADPEGGIESLAKLAPDVVIIGLTGNAQPLDTAAVRTLLPQATVLVLSADLTQLMGPGEDDVVEFTPDALADRLSR
jgi:DNA-binding NarL/FixJ family response regulator